MKYLKSYYQHNGTLAEHAQKNTIKLLEVKNGYRISD